VASTIPRDPTAVFSESQIKLYLKRTTGFPQRSTLNSALIIASYHQLINLLWRCVKPVFIE
jgi:hypothetical protein